MVSAGTYRRIAKMCFGEKLDFSDCTVVREKGQIILRCGEEIICQTGSRSSVEHVFYIYFILSGNRVSPEDRLDLTRIGMDGCQLIDHVLNWWSGT